MLPRAHVLPTGPTVSGGERWPLTRKQFDRKSLRRRRSSPLEGHVHGAPRSARELLDGLADAAEVERISPRHFFELGPSCSRADQVRWKDWPVRLPIARCYGPDNCRLASLPQHWAPPWQSSCRMKEGRGHLVLDALTWRQWIEYLRLGTDWMRSAVTPSSERVTAAGEGPVHKAWVPPTSTSARAPPVAHFREAYALVTARPGGGSTTHRRWGGSRLASPDPVDPSGRDALQANDHGLAALLAPRDIPAQRRPRQSVAPRGQRRRGAGPACVDSRVRQDDHRFRQNRWTRAS